MHDALLWLNMSMIQVGYFKHRAGAGEGRMRAIKARAFCGQTVQMVGHFVTLRNMTVYMHNHMLGLGLGLGFGLTLKHNYAYTAMRNEEITK